MANAFKNLKDGDITVTRTPLHEAIPLTGTIVSGTYQTVPGTELGIKNFSHGIFQSVFDYPHLSSSANHILDLSLGYSANSTLSQSIGTTGFAGFQQDKKINIYNEMAQVLMGHDATGSIKEFKIPGGDFIREAYFMSYTRLLTKDEVDKNNFSLKLNKKIGYKPGDLRKTMILDEITLPSSDNETTFYTDSPAGEYSVLSSSMSGNIGLLFYQAGIAVIGTSSMKQLTASVSLGGKTSTTTKGGHIPEGIVSASISGNCNDFRFHFANNDFNNTTELNSTIYFCRANHNEYNYSANPTYLTASKIRVKESTLDEPVSYITTVGLYSPANELLATAKLSEPLKKTPNTELTLRVRLDY